MPKYLSRDELYRMLQRELPDDVYADGAPSAFFTTADMSAIAKTMGTAYSNLERIYENYFPQSADEKIGDWEVQVFGMVGDSSLSLQERRDRVIAKIRERHGITMMDIEEAITGAFPDLAPSGFDIIEWGCDSGGWVLDESLLDVSTILNGQNLVDATGPGLCHADPATYGKTADEWAEMQRQAYTYEVEIFNRILTPAERAAMDALLTRREPARSTHVITDDVNRYVDSKQLLFAGAGYLDYGTIFHPQPTDRWAISWWMNPTDVNLALFSNCDVDGATNGIEVDFLSPSTLYVFWGEGISNYNEFTFDISPPLDPASDHHFLLAYDGAGTMSLWVDGVSRSVTLSGPGGVVSTAYTVNTVFGKQRFSRPYEGYLNDVLIGLDFRRNLTAADAATLYNGGTPGNIEDTLLRSFFQNWYWSGDEGDTALLIRDRLGSNDATVVGAVSIVDYP